MCRFESLESTESAFGTVRVIAIFPIQYSIEEEKLMEEESSDFEDYN